MKMKFRCWDEDHFVYSDDKWDRDYPQDGDGWFGFEKGVLKCWVSETVTPSDPLEAPYPSSTELESPIEQYTGLKDKKGVEIYEGDIVKQRRCGRFGNREVKFNKGQFYAGHNTGSSTIKRQKMLRPCDTEVIGNIHENKDLL